MNKIKPYAKAAVGFAAAFVGAVATAATDDRITTGEWWAAAAAGLGTLAVVYGVPNRPRP